MTLQHGDQMLARYRREVADARELLGFTVATGRRVDDRIVAAILRAEDLSGSRLMPSVDERIAFEAAYRDLAHLVWPVTVETLRATSSDCPRKSIFAPWGPTSEAKIWSRKLWAVAAAILASIFWAQDHLTTEHLDRYAPLLFGALGALTYLLRSCHEYLHRREFDRNRIPEYYNRLLLGMVGGSAILLFNFPQDQVTPNAIAFLVGYNTDLLFSTLERIASAVLPKVGTEAPRPSILPNPQPAASTASKEEVSDERLQRIQRFLAETERPQYAPGGLQGVWDDRTKAAIVAFLSSNAEALPVDRLAAASLDFASMDREALIAHMSVFVAPNI